MQALRNKGTFLTHQLAFPARTGWGISLNQCMQLISSLIHSRKNHPTCLHRHSNNSATVKAIQRIDNAAQSFALELFKTHLMIFLKHNTKTQPALSRLDAKLEKAVVCVLSLPDNNPEADLAKWANTTAGSSPLQAPTPTLATMNFPIETMSFAEVSWELKVALEASCLIH